MKVLFIDPTDSIINFGMRVIASYLTANGHDVKIIFLPPCRIDINYNYPISVYNELNDFISDADIIGFSFVSNYFGQARFLTNYIKKNYDKPVIWGGIHAMAMPDESIQYADILCMGEGEEAMLDLVNRISEGSAYYDIPNLWFKKNGSVIKNEVRNLEHNLDKYPAAYWELGNQFILENNRIVTIDKARLKDLLICEGDYFGLPSHYVRSFTIMTSRGCPYSCTYCCNNLFRDMYKGKGKLLRSRSNEVVMDELVQVIEKYPFIDLIFFYDDDFTTSRKKDLKEFLTLYKEKINLPFKINITPESVTEENMALLADAGLVSIEMGLQTASLRMNKEIYKRHFNPQHYLRAAGIINKYRQIKLYHDMIFDNPFETADDFVATINFLRKLPKPFKLSAFSLTFFPGTYLYRYAKEQKFITSDVDDVFQKKNNQLYENKEPYLKFLLFLLRVSVKITFFPPMILDFFTSKPSLKVLNSRSLSWFWSAVLKLKGFLRVGIANIIKSRQIKVSSNAT